MNTSLALILAGIGISASGFAIFKKLEGKAGEPSPAKGEETDANGVRRLHLSKASKNWVDRQLPLDQVSSLWVDPPKEKKPIPRPEFQRPEIGEFWDEIVAPRQQMNNGATEVIASILKMLDKHGDCPSVVRNPKHSSESENSYSDNEFKMLAQVPLWEHTLEVARNMAMRVGRELLIPDAVIVALGHDLGKIPAYHERGYATGDHARISGTALLGMKEFNALPNHEELMEIVKGHHYLKPKDAMTTLLKECDQITRNKEFAVKMNTAVAADLQGAKTVGQTAPKVSSQPQVSVTASIPAANLPQPEKDPDVQPSLPLGQAAPEHVQPERIEIPWVNLDALLSELKGWINQTVSGRWGAVSMPDGTVYFNDTTLWNALNKIAPNEIKPELAAASGNAAMKRSILHSVVWTLSEVRNAIAADMLKPEHYMVPVTIIAGTGKPVVGLPMLIPFRAEAFGTLPSDLENLKGKAIRSMVKSIKPRLISDQS